MVVYCVYFICFSSDLGIKRSTEGDLPKDVKNEVRDGRLQVEDLSGLCQLVELAEQDFDVAIDERFEVFDRCL